MSVSTRGHTSELRALYRGGDAWCFHTEPTRSPALPLRRASLVRTSVVQQTSVVPCQCRFCPTERSKVQTSLNLPVLFVSMPQMRACSRDDDHNVAVFQQHGRWGCLSVSNHASLRWRNPIYKTLRELMMSFFDDVSASCLHLRFLLPDLAVAPFTSISVHDDRST